jgi:hypothetical protein
METRVPVVAKPVLADDPYVSVPGGAALRK